MASKHSKIAMIGGAVAALIAVAVMAVAVADARQPAGRFGPRRGFGPGFGMGRMAFGPELRGLDLTDAQRDQIRTLMRSHDAELRALAERGFTAQRALQAAVTAETVDEAAIRQASAGVAAVEADGAVLRARIHAEVFQVLTPEQQQKARDRRTQMQQRMEERRKLGPRR